MIVKVRIVWDLNCQGDGTSHMGKKFCFFCLVSFEEKTKVRGSSKNVQSIKQLNIAEFERDKRINLFHNNWLKHLFINKQG